MTNNPNFVPRVRWSGLSAMFVIGSLAAAMAASPVSAQTTPPARPAPGQAQPPPQPRPQTPPPPAQSDNELRRRNQELEAQLQELALQLQDSREEMESMRLRIIELERQLGEARRGRATPTPPPSASGTQPSTQPDSVTIDESLPTASPRALMNAVRESFGQTYAKSNIGTPGDPQRAAYIKNINRWKSWINRNFRGPMNWHVRIIASQMSDRGERILTLIAVDPISGTKLGDQFEVSLPRSMTDRLAWLHRGDNDPGVLVLKGTLIPEVRVNEERGERGAFDRPPFIGPFLELLYNIEIKSLMPVEQEKAAAEEKAAAPIQVTPAATEKPKPMPPKPTPKPAEKAPATPKPASPGK